MPQAAAGASVQYGQAAQTAQTAQTAQVQTNAPQCAWYERPGPDGCQFSVAYFLGAPGRLVTALLPAGTSLQVAEAVGLLASAGFWLGAAWLVRRSFR